MSEVKDAADKIMGALGSKCNILMSKINAIECLGVG
jgi:hypothetical protein